MPTEVVACPDEISAAAEAARRVLAVLRAATSRGGTPGLALSGGRIARRFFEELVARAVSEGVDLKSVDFFWADERCVPPEDALANFATAREALLEPARVPTRRVHRLEGELDPALAVARATADWRAWQSARGEADPGLDLVVLGVGEDGHVASLFPANLKADLAATEPFRAVTGPKPPPRRLTMGYPMLWEAGRVVVLATGPGKEAVVDGSLSGQIDTPLSRVLAGRDARGRPTVVVRQM
jgi:6-phosphogluconolactonase